MPKAVSDVVTAVVVTHDSAQVLPACLAALAAEGVPALVVDNASSDVTRAVARGQGAAVLENALNQGYGRANNRGVRVCETPYVLIVNPDVEVQPGALAALLAAAARYDDAALLAPRIVEPSGRVFLQPRSLLAPPHLNRARAIVTPEGDACLPFLSGACLLVRREAFLSVGGFDPDIFLFYEDDDLCRRLRDVGFSLVHVDAAQAKHGRGRSTLADPRRRFTARWHLSWSQAHVAAKYGLPAPIFWPVLKHVAKAVAYGLMLDRGKMAAHAGSAAGALAWRRGATALGRQGLAAGSAKDAGRESGLR